ncbi:KTSC domain-containing protein [Vibrio sp.]|uniref:KTSC domain-containing protein n=1 Tax=Vibrio sp. TaxID=678 RepID=UPI003D0B4F74
MSHIGYSAVSRLLDIRFENGGGYRYSGVNNSIWNSFYYSTSHGTYFNKYIRGKYASAKIEY